MLPYWLMFVLWAGLALQAERRRAGDTRYLFFVAISLLTTLMIGLRFEVGGDWGSYLRMYNNIFFLTLPASLGQTDPGYGALNWLAAQSGLGIPLVNVVCAALFMGGVARLAWRQPNPALAMLVAVPYLIIVVAMGYTRQAAAIGLICLAVADASERRVLRLVILIGIATLFHKTAILMLPIVLVPFLRRNLVYSLFGGAVFLVLFILLLRDSSDRMITTYVDSNYDSQGAVIRIGMNVVAAGLFLLLRKRIEMPTFQKSFWTGCAVVSCVSVAALAVSSATSGVDRLSLYIIPLQMVTYARLPYVLGTRNRALPSILLLIVGYSFTVQYVWLTRAQNAGYWVPYASVLQDER